MCKKRNSVILKFPDRDFPWLTVNESCRIDPCMRQKILKLFHRGVRTVACCCGHGVYSETIVVKNRVNNCFYELNSMKNVPRKKRFYKKDKKGFYYIPEAHGEN